MGVILGRAATRLWAHRAVALNLAMDWGVAMVDWMASMEVVRNFMSSNISIVDKPRSRVSTMFLRQALGVYKGLSNNARVESSAGRSSASSRSLSKKRSLSVQQAIW